MQVNSANTVNKKIVLVLYNEAVDLLQRFKVSLATEPVPFQSAPGFGSNSGYGSWWKSGTYKFFSLEFYPPQNKP